MKPQKYIRNPRIIEKDGLFNIYEYGKYGDMYELDLKALRQLGQDISTYLAEKDEKAPFQEEIEDE